MIKRLILLIITLHTLSSQSTLYAENCSISEASIAALEKPPEWFAQKEKLHYVEPNEAGYTRRKLKDGFAYYNGRRRVLEKEIIKWINDLKIPPGAEDVWICQKKNGHITAKWRDSVGRSQYKYHHKWIAARAKHKYQKIGAFGLALSHFRRVYKQDTANRESFTSEQIHAAAVWAMDLTSIRIGNKIYAKSNETYGLTTLEKRHVSVVKNTVTFSFVGKSSKKHELVFTNKILAFLIRKLKKIPGKRLFKYKSENKWINISSSSLNRYIDENAGLPFSAKNFRTWHGTSEAMKILLKEILPKSEKEAQTLQKKVLELVAKKLGNTPTVARDNYIFPPIFDIHRKGELASYASQAQQYDLGLPTHEAATVILLGGIAR